MDNWIEKSYKHIGKYFDYTSKEDFFVALSESNNNWLHVHSMYSIFDSAQSTDDICEQAQNKNCKNVTLTDHGTLLGIEAFMKSGKKYGINTIPGVETYREHRCHMILFARNYDGYVSISKAMREANTHIEEIKGTKLSNAIMTKDICEHFFRNNTDIVATSACIQGTVGYILLANHRIKKKISKDEEKLILYKENYENYLNAKKEALNTKQKISVLKKEKTGYKKYTGKGHINRIKKMEDKISTISPEDKSYEEISNKLAVAKNAYENAIIYINELDQAINDCENNSSTYKAIMGQNKKAYDIYERSYQKVNEVSYYAEDELYEQAKQELKWYKNVFPLFFIELQYHGLEKEAYVMPILVKLARELDIPLIAANDAHMKDNTADSIEARRIVRYNYFEKAQKVSDVDKELYLKTDKELFTALIKVVDEDAANEALFNTKILETCKVIFPHESHYPSVNNEKTFEEMIEDGKRRRLLEGGIVVWTNEYESRLLHELDVVKKMGYVDYHKVVEDFCREGRYLGRIPKTEIDNAPEDYSKMHEWIDEKGFPEGIGIGLGRGSGVGSLICYLLGITNVNPIQYNLLFERFLNPERVSMPDIDTDIATRLRPLLIRYIKWKYGERSICSIATETTYAAKSSIQMAGRDLASQKYGDLPKKEADRQTTIFLNTVTSKLSGVIPEVPNIKLSDCEDTVKSLIENNPDMKTIWDHAKLIEGKLQAIGVHAGGIIISDNDDVNDYIPLAYNLKKKVWVAQCDMIVAEEKGLLKMDLLGLATLDCINDTLYFIRKYRGIEININTINFEPEVFSNIFCTGNTNSVFQLESSGMKSMLKDFKPDSIEDLILLVACYRPGPLQYLDKIIKVKNKEIPVTYKTPELEPILRETYGAIVYQEEVMQIFQSLAGYSLGGADLVRRAMSKKKEKVLEKERHAFIYGDVERGIEGCKNRGISEDVANELFDEVLDFAKYAFNKSHATAYAIVAYQTAWLKFHYPKEFLCAMFNNVDQDKFGPVIDDCNLYNIKLLPPDINNSYYDFVVENGDIRFGISGIKGIGDANKPIILKICKERCNGIYESIEDFLLRNLVLKENETYSTIPNKLYNIFARAGIFDTLGYNREDICNIEIKDGEYSYIKNLIQKLEVPKNNASLSYNINNEIELLGAIVSINPLQDYHNDEKYSCNRICDLIEDSQCTVYGFVTTIKEKTNKYGQDIYIVEIRGKTGKLIIYTNVTIHSRYTPDMLLHKVVKCKGRYKYDILFASELTFMQPDILDYFIDLTEEDTTRMLMSLLKRTVHRDINVKVLCHWLQKDGKLIETNRPKLTDIKLTYREMNLLKQEGIVFHKWNI